MEYGDIVVPFPVLQTAAENIKQNYAALSQALDRLEQEVAPMLNSWSGDAQSAYLQQKQLWEESARNMATLLKQLGLAVAETHDEWVGTERRNTQLFPGSSS